MGQRPARRNQQRSDEAKIRAQEVAKHVLRGKTYAAVAKIVGVSPATITNDMKWMRQVWTKKAAKPYAELIASKLARLDELYAVAWECLEKSQRDLLETGDDVIESDSGKTTKTSTKRKQQSGSAALIAEVRNITRQQCELLGLLDREARESGVTVDDEQVISLVIDDRKGIDRLKLLDLGEFEEAKQAAQAPQAG